MPDPVHVGQLVAEHVDHLRVHPVETPRGWTASLTLAGYLGERDDAVRVSDELRERLLRALAADDLLDEPEPGSRMTEGHALVAAA